MHFQVEDLSILAPSPGRRVQGLSSNDLLNGKSGLSPGIIGHEYATKITAREFSLSKAKQLVERGIRQVDAALLIEDNDSERTVLYQRIQVNGLFLQVKRNPVSLAHGRSYNQSDSGNHQHKQADLGRDAGHSRENVHGNNHAEIECQHSADHPTNSLPHGNPDDGNKAQIK
jgi:hypothetical protein